MSEAILQDFTKTLISMTEMEVGEKSPDIPPTPAAPAREESAKLDQSLLGLSSLLSIITSNIPAPSESSRCWLEMILVETALRNRDRFSLLWPLISAHYSKTLGRVASSPAVDIVVKLDYSTERCERNIKKKYLQYPLQIAT